MRRISLARGTLISSPQERQGFKAQWCITHAFHWRELRSQSWPASHLQLSVDAGQTGQDPVCVWNLHCNGRPRWELWVATALRAVSLFLSFRKPPPSPHCTSHLDWVPIKTLPGQSRFYHLWTWVPGPRNIMTSVPLWKSNTMLLHAFSTNAPVCKDRKPKTGKQEWKCCSGNNLRDHTNITWCMTSYLKTS